MTYLVRIKNVDFSPIRVAQIELNTSVVAGLQSFYDLRTSESTAVTNALTGIADGRVIGSPVFTSMHAVVGNGSAISFGSKPDTASRTVAVIFLVSRSTSERSYPFGCWPGNPLINGGEYIDCFGTNADYEGTVFEPGTTTYATNATTPVINLGLNNYEFLAYRVTDQSLVKLTHPRSGVSTTRATTKSFMFPNPTNYSAPLYANATNLSDPAVMFAHWDRVLSDEELATFYSEMKAMFPSHSI